METYSSNEFDFESSEEESEKTPKNFANYRFRANNGKSFKAFTHMQTIDEVDESSSRFDMKQSDRVSKRKRFIKK